MGRRYREPGSTRQALDDHAPLPAAPSPFKKVDKLLEAARCMFRARQTAARLRQQADEDYTNDADLLRAARESAAFARAWTRHFHASFELTSDQEPICRTSREHKLTRLEREILCVLLLDRLSLLSEMLTSAHDVLAVLCLPTGRSLTAMRAMSERGRLFRGQIIAYDDEERDLRDRELVLDPGLIEQVLHGRGRSLTRFAVRSPDQLYDRISVLTQALANRSHAVERLQRGFGDKSDLYKCERRLHHLFARLQGCLARRRAWPMAKLFFDHEALQNPVTRMMALALIGKERGHLAADHELFTGAGLAKAACLTTDQVEKAVRELGPGRLLAAHGLVEPCGGFDALIGDNPAELAASEFELTDRALDLLKLQRTENPRRGEGPQVRQPKVRLEQLVLSDEVNGALEMAFAQANHGRVLTEDWGLGQVVAYGRAVTLMFAGPPGVGKTACAEALAHALGRPILVADFSRIQNCYVGVTEKNISRVFRVARSQGAVLFWDEADAMFYNRDLATVTWEVRNVNVILQELERFDGVCVLATNRRASLDPALERRIAMKIDFPRPDRPMRRAIWQRLLPDSMPLGPDVDVDALAAFALTGGQIKNAVLNAARMALARGPDAKVSMADFQKATEMEAATGLKPSRNLGFCNDHDRFKDAG